MRFDVTRFNQYKEIVILVGDVEIKTGLLDKEEIKMLILELNNVIEELEEV